MTPVLPNVRFKAKVDALNFIAPQAPNLHKRHFDHAFGALGFPLHDPTLDEIRQLSAHSLRYVEIAVDARPRRAVPPAKRLIVLKEAYDTIARCLYPWHGPFMTPGVRTNDGVTTKGATNRLPVFNVADVRAETAYYGDKKDPAYLKLYLKTIDQGKALPADKLVVRLELVLQDEALPFLGLNRVGDLFDVNLRTLLAGYFHCGRPVLNGIDINSKLYRRRDQMAPGLYAVVQEARRKHALAEIQAQTLRGGMHSLVGYATAKLNARAGHEALNRRIREPLSRIL